MGYTTEFEGQFTLDRKLEPRHAAYLRAFNQTRRMRRNPTIAETMPDPLRIAVGLPIGPDACYFVGGTGPFGQDNDASVTNYNLEPWGQPELWCNWEPTPADDGVQWNGAENFGSYVKWLEYIVQHFLAPWGYTLNGKVAWQGERGADAGIIRVTDNQVVAATLALASME